MKLPLDMFLRDHVFHLERALVFSKTNGDGLSELGAKPGFYLDGIYLSPGLRYKENVLVLDYEAVRTTSRLFWVPKNFLLPGLQNRHFLT